jgi:hypothetical protein
VKSRLTDDFLGCFAKLPEGVKQQARKAYRLWRGDPRHPSLHFKKIHGQDSLYSVRIGRGWRAVGLLDEDTITWFWIGSHAEYERLITM